MKELFREQDFTRVGYFQTVLEGEGIRTHIRNQDLAGAGLSEMPIPDFFPALCVVNDEDYPRAIEILRRHAEESAKNSESEVNCPNCSEENPGNFDVCWSCGSPLSPPGTRSPA